MPLIPPEDQAREIVEDLRRTIPTEIQALINKAQAIQREQWACERTGGHYYFGVGPSLILYPEEYFEPGWVVRQVFDGKLPNRAVFSAAWRCSNCGASLSQTEAEHYINNKSQVRAYWSSRLWC